MRKFETSGKGVATIFSAKVPSLYSEKKSGGPKVAELRTLELAPQYVQMPGPVSMHVASQGGRHHRLMRVEHLTTTLVIKDASQVHSSGRCIVEKSSIIKN